MDFEPEDEEEAAKDGDPPAYRVPNSGTMAPPNFTAPSVRPRLEFVFPAWLRVGVRDNQQVHRGQHVAYRISSFVSLPCTCTLLLFSCFSLFRIVDIHLCYPIFSESTCIGRAQKRHTRLRPKSLGNQMCAPRLTDCSLYRKGTVHGPRGTSPVLYRLRSASLPPEPSDHAPRSTAVTSTSRLLMCF